MIYLFICFIGIRWSEKKGKEPDFCLVPIGALSKNPTLVVEAAYGNETEKLLLYFLREWLKYPSVKVAIGLKVRKFSKPADFSMTFYLLQKGRPLFKTILDGTQKSVPVLPKIAIENLFQDARIPAPFASNDFLTLDLLMLRDWMISALFP